MWCGDLRSVLWAGQSAALALVRWVGTASVIALCGGVNQFCAVFQVDLNSTFQAVAATWKLGCVWTNL